MFLLAAPLSDSQWWICLGAVPRSLSRSLLSFQVILSNSSTYPHHLQGSKYHCLYIVNPPFLFPRKAWTSNPPVPGALAIAAAVHLPAVAPPPSQRAPLSSHLVIIGAHLGSLCQEPGVGVGEGGVNRHLAVPAEFVVCLEEASARSPSWSGMGTYFVSSAASSAARAPPVIQ